MILHADVVHVQVVARGDGADAVEEAFLAAGARHGVHDHIRVGQQLANPGGHFVGNLLGLLKGHVARHRDGDVGEVTAAGAANAHAVDFQHAVDPVHLFDDAIADARRSGVQQGVNGLPRQPRADVHDDAGHEEGGDRIGLRQPWPMEYVPAQP